MTRQELEEFLATHTVYEIAEFHIQKCVERFSDGFDSGYELGLGDGSKEANGYIFDIVTRKWVKDAA